MQEYTGIKLLVSPENAVKAVKEEIKKGKDKLNRIPVPNGSRSYSMGNRPTIAMAWHSQSTKTLKTIFNDCKFVRDYELLGNPSIDYNKSPNEQFDELRKYYKKHLEQLNKGLSLVGSTRSRVMRILHFLHNFWRHWPKTLNDWAAWAAIIGVVVGLPIAYAALKVSQSQVSKSSEYSSDSSLLADKSDLRSSSVTTTEPNNIAGNFKIIEFPDPQLALGIREAINKPYGDITETDLVGLVKLNLGSHYTIHNLYGIEKCTNLSELTIHGENLTDITPLGNLKKLTWLALYSSKVSDISSLVYLDRLRNLFLDSDYLTEIGSLSEIKGLTRLELTCSNLADISAISSLTGLERLVLNGCQATKLPPLARLTKLKDLVLNGGPISDIESLSQLTQLESLMLNGPNITDVSALASLLNLTSLSLNARAIEDLSPIEGLTSLSKLSISDATMQDLSLVSNLTGLTDLTLGNQITTISGIENLGNLTTLHLSGNKIVDISPLRTLTNLKEIGLAGNDITDLSPLVDNPGIGSGDMIFLAGNPLDQNSLEVCIPRLIERGVTVGSL